MIYDVKDYSKKRLYDFRAYQGLDLSLPVSLFEQGYIFKKVKNDLHIVFGLQGSYNGIYNLFGKSFISCDTDVFEEYDFLDINSMLQSIDYRKEDWDRLPLHQQLCDLISYFGYEEILEYYDVFGVHDGGLYDF